MTETRRKDLQPGDHVRLLRAWNVRNVGKTARILEINPTEVVVQFDDTEQGNPSRLTTTNDDDAFEKIEGQVGADAIRYPSAF